MICIRRHPPRRLLLPDRSHLPHPVNHAYIAPSSTYIGLTSTRLISRIPLPSRLPRTAPHRRRRQDGEKTPPLFSSPSHKLLLEIEALMEVELEGGNALGARHRWRKQILTGGASPEPHLHGSSGREERTEAAVLTGANHDGRSLSPVSAAAVGEWRNLASNNLQGPIPANISSCTALNKFNVYGNELNGSIPAGFQKLESLDLLLLGLSGHFGLGNTNNFAIIDVAGAFIVGG
uniref:Leucine-rich repeat-containing N-terminal plant-type domain-containing protein n=1 Tax=Oryza rufipogon TaxID=4529 RepID=A0A0E0NBR0_ORYRU